MTETRSVVLGCGAYLPAKILTNADLARMVDTSDEWITERTGIKARHIAVEGENTSDLGLAAANVRQRSADTNSLSAPSQHDLTAAVRQVRDK